jgi:eukaryotic-like serine/threonine-protein kinase
VLAPGARIGSFEVLAPLGAGGMGEVYRARDPRLGREVAIKVLPAERLADESRKRRLVQEARAASALNHPNIVTIHDIESADGIDFIVMEYVAGQTLDGLIPKNGMPVRDALRVAIPVADAVAAAHAKGIVHRDLKPANVIVSRDGVVKVLDFGLAKLVADEDADDGQTQTTASGSGALSRSGAITGTAAYMSPEQATGGNVDTRSDVFSFGAVLYEMVTGRRAFAGQTVSETLTAVVSEQPRPPGELVRGLPEGLELLIQRCLRKEAERRFQHMADLKVELQDIKDGRDSRKGRGRRRWIGRAAGIFVLTVIAATAAWLWHKRAPTVPQPTLLPLTALSGTETNPTFSPDGSQLAFQWNGARGDNWDVYITMVGSSVTRRLTVDPGENGWPSWSPDGRRIAYVRAMRGNQALGTLRLLSPIGGEDHQLSEQAVPLTAPAWSPDGRWLATGSSIQAVNAAPGLDRGIRLFHVPDGSSRVVTSPGGAEFHSHPALSPDGKQLGYASCRDITCWIDVVGIDADLATTGTPRRLTRRVVAPTRLAWTRDAGSLVYGDDVTQRLWRVSVVSNTPPERIELAGFGAADPAIAATGERLAFSRSLANSDIYRFRPGRSPNVVVGSSFEEWNPALSPDGTRLAFASSRGDLGGSADEIWLSTADGSNATQLTVGPGFSQGSPRWSPDGRAIAFDSVGEDGRWHVWMIDAAGGAPRRLTSDAASENHPTWSRDGRFIYFSYGPDGGKTIWRAPVTGGSAAVQVTHSGGGRSELSPDGRTLYVQHSFVASALLAVPLDGGTERAVLDCVPRYGFAVTLAGVYHLPCGGSDSAPLLLWNPVTGKDRLLGTLEGVALGLTVSADDRTILYTKRVAQGSDLVLIENFR